MIYLIFLALLLAVGGCSSQPAFREQFPNTCMIAKDVNDNKTREVKFYPCKLEYHDYQKTR